MVLLKGMMVDPQSARTPLRLWPVNVEKRGWQVYDVMEAVDQWKEAGRTADLLAFRFNTSDPNADDWFRRVTVIRTDPSPFLIVFSNEVTNATPRPTINVWRAPSMIMNCPRLTSTATRCRPPVQVFCRPGAGHPVPGRIHPPNR